MRSSRFSRKAWAGLTKLTSPRVARNVARANDVFHYGVIAFMVSGHYFVGPLWHILFVAFVARCQLAFRGCPLTMLSDFFRSFTEDGEKTVFRQGLTASIYQKHGRKGLPLIVVGWLVIIAVQNMVMNLLGF